MPFSSEGGGGGGGGGGPGSAYVRTRLPKVRPGSGLSGRYY